MPAPEGRHWLYVPPITLENPVVVTDFEGDLLYYKMQASLTAT